MRIRTTRGASMHRHPGSWWCLALLTTLVLGMLSACGDDGEVEPPPPPPEPDASVLATRTADVAQRVAFEGQKTFITVVREPMIDFDEALIDTSELGAVRLLEGLCNDHTCALRFEVEDTTPNTGVTIPVAADAVAVRAAWESDTIRALASLNVWPVDTIELQGSEPESVRGLRYASSATVGAGASFRGISDDPPRWVIFGDAEIEGGIDVSGRGLEGVAGAGDGGAAGEPATGEGGGSAVDEPGSSPDDAAASCASDFERDCGGGGGAGGAAGAGGAGGGSFGLIVLGSLTLGSVNAAGGEGEGGAGGAGGSVFVSARTIDNDPRIDVSGGSGSAEGAEGRIRVDSAAGEFPRGPVLMWADEDLLRLESSYTLVGRAEAGAQIVVRDDEGTERAQGVADADGRFSIAVALNEGMNRLYAEAMLSGVMTRSFTGTSLEFRAGAGGVRIPVGALLDVAYVPDGGQVVIR